MTKTMLNVKTDPDVKKKAQRVAKELGLPLSTIVNALLKQFIRDEQVTFARTYRMTPKLEKLLDEVERDRKAGRNVSEPLSTAKEVQAHLDSLKT